MIDKTERYNRIYSFMKRNAHVYTHIRHLRWMSYFNQICKDKNDGYSKEEFDKTRLALKQAKLLQQQLTEEVFQQMENFVCNPTTAGIWLSYKKHIKLLHQFPDKSRHYLITLETGEKLIGERLYIPQDYRRLCHSSNLYTKLRIFTVTE